MFTVKPLGIFTKIRIKISGEQNVPFISEMMYHKCLPVFEFGLSQNLQEF